MNPSYCSSYFCLSPKSEETLNEYQKRLIETLYKLQDEVENGKLPLKKIVDTFNNGLPETAKLSRKRVGAIMRRDFELATKKSTGGVYVLIWESEKIQKIFSKYKSTKSTKSNSLCK
jgi:hypothetical protein